ncbi:transglycosylase SLT domain-containing protein [Streptomyces noursei]|uniref:transglycosylase SLT domain-containing protein n=1 Tax=Streptomyces noursei TaxID=1971 RepID=UPI001677A3FC|nr:transglycosylase SLT domain-containing protein [Streptomyces noursei]MCZ1015614.1 transglycosylase SLT domain-containing protein [Streptomyces noursei]GGW89473.1 hypothetical protein GCM10010341_07870 [Streptomyces noursei]
MAGTDRSAIKVGSGYVEIAPRIARDALAKFRTDLKSTLAKAGEEAGKGFSQAATKGLSALPKAAATAAKKAKAEIEASAKNTAQSVLRIEQNLTKQLGEETTKRLRGEQQLTKERGRLHDQAVRSATEALSRTMRAETQAGEHATRTQQATERARIREIGQREQRAVAAERAQQAAQRQAREESNRGDRLAAESSRTMQRQRVQSAREAEREIREEARRTAAAVQAARRADLENQIRAQSQISANLRQQIAGYNQHIQRLENNTNQSILRVRDSLKKSGSGIEEVGSSASEVGRLITHNLLAPLTLVSSMLTTIGVKAADNFKTLELGLQGMHLKQRDINTLSRNMTNYAVATPYSLEDMQTYSTRFARVFSSHGASSKVAATKTENVIKAVGDNAAASGILDPNMVQRGLYALTIMGDTDRVNMRNLKQFEAATGMPAEELATMMGYKADKKNKTAFAAMAAAMQDPKKSGGVSGVKFIDNIIEHWQGSDREGAAAKIGAQTITGRVQSLQERAKLGLSNLFIQRGEGDKPSDYTELGQKIMGKGGLLDDLTKLGSSLAKSGFAEDTLKTFFDVISKFTGWAQDTIDFVRQHPAIKDALLTFAKLAAVAAPLLIGMGLLTKTIGKLTKLAGSGLRPVAAGARGVRGGVRAGRQFFSGTRSWAEGGTFREGYRNKRAQLRGGDERGPIRRATDRMRGRNSQVEEIRVQTGEAERALRQSEQRVQALRDALQQVNRTSLDGIVNQLVGSAGGRSVASSARQAHTEVRRVQAEGVDPLNRSKLTQLQQELAGARAKAESLVSEAKRAQAGVAQLDGKKLTALKVTVDSAHGTVTDLKNKVDDTAHSVNRLDGRKLDGLKAQFRAAYEAAEKVFQKVGQGTGSGSVAGRIGLLNGRTLNGLKAQFDRVTHAAHDTYQKVGQGTGSGSLAGRIGLLNGRSLTSVKGQVDKLKSALHDADHEAGELNSSLDKIASHRTGGGSSSKGSNNGPTKKRKLSTGGVLPGYTPGVDNIPAILSPGEAVLRPEVTAALGAPLINTWNTMARKGQISRFSGGGIVSRFGLDKIFELIRNENVWPDTSAALNTMALYRKSDAIGGNVRQGIMGAGTGASHFVGADIAEKFNGIYKFATTDSWKFLRRLPTAVGQAIAIIGGAFAPTLGGYFHDDVWKGHGNILERGGRFLDDTFSLKTLTSVFDDLFGGLWESVKSIAGGAKDLLTDPVGTVKDTVSTLWVTGKGEVDQVTDMAKAMKQFVNSPSGYALEVVNDIYATAKEALPNTEGLFDFSDKDKLEAKGPPDISKRYAFDNPPGQGVQRWTPTVQRVLRELGIPLGYTDLILHRIEVESGGNPNAINNWDSNAKAGYPSQGLMQTIPQTFAAYAGPYKGLGITNGLASIYAGLNYAVHRYGSRWPQALSGNQGYWTGTLSASPGLALVGEQGPELVNFRGGERVYSDRQTRDLLSGQEKRYEIHIHEATSEDTTQAVLRAMQYAEAMYGR